MEPISSSEELRSLYKECHDSYLELDASASRHDDPVFVEQLQGLLNKLDHCSRAVRQFQIFSPNETLDDVNSEDLLFAMLEYFQGKLQMKLLEDRVKNVELGVTMLEAFLGKCDQLGVLKKAFPDKDYDDLILGEDTREDKIERFKRSREVQKQLENTKVLLHQSAKADGKADADVSRDVVILTIECAMYASLDDLSSTAKELEMLKQFQSMQLEADKRGPPRRAPEKPSKGLEVTHINRDMKVTRETIQSQVFRPSWRQPTMSLEEYADIEREQALQRQKAEAENENATDLKYHQLLEQGLEDDHELVDKATVRDRNWDDWKDDHPKGAGVTKRF